ncbi:unnamed protein product [Lactuca virosa]|uniref:Uncharacterized protein n=1 Tax=Lactuca virosa TaxID=75947 RepID=A0AAU9MXS7_9ASTR|nr:unnamed protein product [Lactuca virosa]
MENLNEYMMVLKGRKTGVDFLNFIQFPLFSICTVEERRRRGSEVTLINALCKNRLSYVVVIVCNFREMKVEEQKYNYMPIRLKGESRTMVKDEE